MNDQVPNLEHSTLNQPPRSKQPRRRSSIAWWLAGLMAGLVMIVELPNEIDSWRFAAALESRAAGNKREAADALAALLKKSPQDSRFLAAEFQWNVEDGNHEAALEYIQQQFVGEPEGSLRHADLLMLRIESYLHLHRYSEAVADCVELARFSKTSGIPPRDQMLNQLAYARALGNLELDAALIDSDIAIDIGRAELADAEQLLQKTDAKKPTFADQAKLARRRSSLAGSLDTRGLVRFKLADYAAAQTDFDEAIDLLRPVREFNRLNERHYSTNARKYETFKELKKQKRHHDAVIYYHRSLNLKRLGREADAQQDWDKARELLGKDPDESLF